jgi:putative FmdB family regulatory protein
MPLYEYFCDRCRMSFEALVPSRGLHQEVHACTSCGERSRRILSAVNFSTEQPRPELSASCARDGRPHVTNLMLPPAARLCWMDNESAARLAAYKAGRGAEYDDTVAARKDLALRHGEGQGSKPAHQPHSHSPLSDPAVFANRSKAAQAEKAAESAALRKARAAKQS